MVKCVKKFKNYGHLFLFYFYKYLTKHLFNFYVPVFVFMDLAIGLELIGREVGVCLIHKKKHIPPDQSDLLSFYPRHFLDLVLISLEIYFKFIHRIYIENA